ncbi:MAG: hypothetical protein VXV83_02120, partial [Pseudomonadota bacterium]|nr:hypothetical protein [Pseudomonadota bacterium]
MNFKKNKHRRYNMNNSGRHVFLSNLSSPFYKDMSSGVGKIKVHQRSFKNKYLAAKFCKRISRLYKAMFKRKLKIVRNGNLRKI